MKNAKLIKKLEQTSEWRGMIPDLLLTIREREVILKLLREAAEMPL